MAAILLCAKYLLLPAACVVLIMAVSSGDHTLAIVGVELMGLAVLVAVLQWMLAARTGCPLCLTPVLARKTCMTHRHAKTFLESHRLRVALAIVLRNSFQCPYCHEPTVLEVREKRHHN
jgi:hypothetical protein